jgi:hypothetical protein
MCKKCLFCDKKIEKTTIKINEDRFCSDKCVSSWSKNNINVDLYEGNLKKKICIYCNKKYLSIYSYKRCCSTQCRLECQRSKIIKSCKNCNKEIVKKYRCDGMSFCSYDCGQIWISNNIDAENYSGKMNKHICSGCDKYFLSYYKNKNICYNCKGKVKRGKMIKRSCTHCLKEYEVTNGRYRSKIKEGHKNNFCSRECVLKYHTGHRSPLWIEDRSKIKDPKKNIRRSKEMKEFNKVVYERDQYTCAICEKTGGKLNAHHIKMFSKYPELIFDTSNGITLCEKCHRSIRGKEEEYEDFFKEIVNSRLEVYYYDYSL